MARGGRRQGAPGVAYGNRSDLNAPKLAPTAVPGQPYGAAGAQIQAQQVVPMAPPPGSAPPPSPSAGAGAGQAPIQPGGLGALARPTERPDEPVTAGVPTGPGPGPSAIPGYRSSVQTLGSLIGGLAASPGATPEVQGLAAFVNSGRV